MLGGNASPYGCDDGVDQGQGDADAEWSAVAGRISAEHVKLPSRKYVGSVP